MNPVRVTLMLRQPTVLGKEITPASLSRPTALTTCEHLICSRSEATVMYRVVVVLLFLASGFLGFDYLQAADRCTRNGDESLSRAKTWADLHRWRREFPECDDGYLAEGVSDFVTRSLAMRWSALPSLRGELHGDPEFERFVLRHIDASVEAADLKAVVHNATRRCRDEERSLCSAVALAARGALRELTPPVECEQRSTHRQAT